MSHTKYQSSGPSCFREEEFLRFHYITYGKMKGPRGGAIFDPRGKIIANFIKAPNWFFMQNIEALGFIVSDKMIFKVCILKNPFLAPWPNYSMDRNDNSNSCRGHPKEHPSQVSSTLAKRFRRRSRLKKLLTHARTHGRTDARTDDGRRTTRDHNSSPWALCAQVS